MKVLIIEDEYPNVQRLQRILATIDCNIEIAGIEDSVQGALAFLKNQRDIDLLFLDIQLSDGIGFEVLNQMDQSIPVIITSAYDQYALMAFQHLSVDYLLKPIKEQALRKSLEKYRKNFKVIPNFPTTQIQSFFQPVQRTKTIIGRRGKNRYPIQSDKIAYCFTEERETWILTEDGKEFIISDNLDQLESILCAHTFFRTNRKTICAKKAVEKFEILPKSRIKLSVKPSSTFEIFISSDKSAAFKNWVCA